MAQTGKSGPIMALLTEATALVFRGRVSINEPLDKTDFCCCWIDNESLVLSYRPKTFPCCLAKSILPINQPATHFLRCISTWMVPMLASSTARHWAKNKLKKKLRILTKKKKRRGGGYMPEAGCSWAPTGLMSQAVEVKRFVLAAQRSHSTPPPV